MGFSIAPLARTLGKAALVGGGMFAAYDVTKYLVTDNMTDGGTPRGTLTGAFMGVRHVVGFSLANIFHPSRLLAANDARASAIQLEKQLFSEGDRPLATDDGGDAFRHTYAAADLTYRLVHDRHMSANEAAGWVRDAGIAHENDSMLPKPHYSRARAMDVHNNDLGISIGLALAADTSGAASLSDKTIAGDVLDEIAAGHAYILDRGAHAPRTSTAADVASADRSALDH